MGYLEHHHQRRFTSLPWRIGDRAEDVQPPWVYGGVDAGAEQIAQHVQQMGPITLCQSMFHELLGNEFTAYPARVIDVRGQFAQPDP